MIPIYLKHFTLCVLNTLLLHNFDRSMLRSVVTLVVRLGFSASVRMHTQIIAIFVNIVN